MPFCPTCKEMIVLPADVPKHVCPPLWYVHLVDYHDPNYAAATYAKTALRAAQCAANFYDFNNNDRIVNGGACQAVVWDKDKRNPHFYLIEAYTEPIYDAKPETIPLPAKYPDNLEEMQTP